MIIEASLVYLEKDGKILMLHRVKKEDDIHEGKWNGLGGKLMKGESPKDCAIREVKEESGLDIKDPIFCGHISFPNFDGRSDWSVFIFRCFDFSGEVCASDEGDLYWIAKDEILNLNLWEGDKIFLPKILAGQKILGKMCYSKGSLVDYHLEDI